MANMIDLGSVRAVLERHKQEILRSYNAVGVGVGKDEEVPESYVIVVYLESADARPNLPVVVDGVPLRFKITGQFKPYNSVPERGAGHG